MSIDFKKFMEETEKCRKKVQKKSEYAEIPIICESHERKLIALERANKLDLKRMAYEYNEFECCGCDSCNIPDFL